MQTAFDENTSDARRPEAYWAAVADLVALIQRTRTLEIPAARAIAANNVVASAEPLATVAIGNCNLRLREALHFLLEARSSDRQGRGAA